MNYRFVAVSDQPEMAPAVADWLLDAFRHGPFCDSMGLNTRTAALPMKCDLAE